MGLTRSPAPPPRSRSPSSASSSGACGYAEWARRRADLWLPWGCRPCGAPPMEAGSRYPPIKFELTADLDAGCQPARASPERCAAPEPPPAAAPRPPSRSRSPRSGAPEAAVPAPPPAAAPARPPPPPPPPRSAAAAAPPPPEEAPAPAAEAAAPATAEAAAAEEATAAEVVAMAGVVAAAAEAAPAAAAAGPEEGEEVQDNRMVLIEIAFGDKSKRVRHRASLRISGLLAAYERKLPSARRGGERGAMRVCDEQGFQQDMELTLGEIQETRAERDPSADPQQPIRLYFEEEDDDWLG